MNNLTSINDKMTTIAARFTTDSVKVRVTYSRTATLFIDANTGAEVREVLNQFIDAIEELKAELPGRKLTMGKHNGYRVWNVYDDGGYFAGKRGSIGVSLTEDEHFGVLAGHAAGRIPSAL